MTSWFDGSFLRANKIFSLPFFLISETSNDPSSESVLKYNVNLPLFPLLQGENVMDGLEDAVGVVVGDAVGTVEGMVLGLSDG